MRLLLIFALVLVWLWPSSAKKSLPPEPYCTVMRLTEPLVINGCLSVLLCDGTYHTFCNDILVEAP